MHSVLSLSTRATDRTTQESCLPSNSIVELRQSLILEVKLRSHFQMCDSVSNVARCPVLWDWAYRLKRPHILWIIMLGQMPQNAVVGIQFSCWAVLCCAVHESPGKWLRATPSFPPVLPVFKPAHVPKEEFPISFAHDTLMSSDSSLILGRQLGSNYRS
jgi:hypothetical protein